ncbi:MAG: hypothetical protein ACLUNO_11145 [Oscillospiraceae bacterium]
MDNVISQTIAACTQLSTTKTGALIVFERSVTLDEQMRSGTTDQFGRDGGAAQEHFLSQSAAA